MLYIRTHTYIRVCVYMYVPGYIYVYICMVSVDSDLLLPCSFTGVMGNHWFLWEAGEG